MSKKIRTSQSEIRQHTATAPRQHLRHRIHRQTMDPSVAFREFASNSSRLEEPADLFLTLHDLSCAMIAVFGFKFRKRDLSVCLERHNSGTRAVLSSCGSRPPPGPPSRRGGPARHQHLHHAGRRCSSKHAEDEGQHAEDEGARRKEFVEDGSESQI